MNTNRVVLPAFGRASLCDLFRLAGFRNGAEIGVWTGLFSRQLCDTIPGLSLTCVDPWAAYDGYREKKRQARLEAAYSETVERLRPFNCRMLRLASVEAAAHVPDGSLDFVYIDGNHAQEFVAADLTAWAPKVRSGGIVAGHDYELAKRHAWIGVAAAVDAYVHAHEIGPVFILAADKAPSFFWWVR